MCGSLGSALKIKLVVLDVHGADEIERGLTAFATEHNAAVLVTPHALTVVKRDLIVALAARVDGILRGAKLAWNAMAGSKVAL